MSFCPLPSSSGKSPPSDSRQDRRLQEKRHVDRRHAAPGYDVNNRQLVVNDDEACIVVEIYRRYLALKLVHALRDELADAGIKSKRRTRPDGAEYGSQKPPVGRCI